jgi:hypothetical protein
MFDFPAAPSVGTIFAPAGGPAWQWNGSTWATVSPTGMVAGSIVMTVLSTPGAGNYVKPAGLKFLEVTAVGGGGGGSRSGTTAATTSSAGGGGGGGGSCISFFNASDLAASEPYVIGAGGTGGGSPGGDGGDTTFKAMVASGGGGAGALMTATTALAGSGRGTGGIPTGGQINIRGGYGTQGEANSGNPGWAKAGCGGTTPFTASITANYTTTNAAPFVALGYGGGSGGGACGYNQTTPTQTSPGGNGVIVLKEYF